MYFVGVLHIKKHATPCHYYVPLKKVINIPLGSNNKVVKNTM